MISAFLLFPVVSFGFFEVDGFFSVRIIFFSGVTSISMASAIVFERTEAVLFSVAD
jgi:hypothetical protein